MQPKIVRSLTPEPALKISIQRSLDLLHRRKIELDGLICWIEQMLRKESQVNGKTTDSSDEHF
jgi:hypothetical protein